MLTFNVRGLGGKIKRRYIMKLVGDEDIDLLCVQETKREDISNWVCHAMWGGMDCEWKSTPTINMGGSLLSIWKKDKFELISHFRGFAYLGLDGVWKENGERVVIINVYAPCNRA
uniref:Endonuclease/exonuclease/phosphatase domain-containing protein n=1 Tax=Cajanus cajan TaxID=3821 RepID=A0A151RW65_CAJCA|nr:hypothetical protein KK1_031611 [Cajanus cajan]